MDVDFRTLKSSIRYKLLTALVVPRPIAWISTVNASGSVNVAPFSFFNVLGNSPPLVGIGFGRKSDGTDKDTYRNITRQGEFVVNLVDEEMVQKMHDSAAPYPSETSEAEALELTTEASTTVLPQRISGSKVHLECEVAQTLSIEQNQIVLGFVRHLHLAEGLVDPTTYRIRPGAFEGIGRLQGPGHYCSSANGFDLGPLPSLPDSTKD